MHPQVMPLRDSLEGRPWRRSGEVLVGVLLLGWKGVFVQPIEQLLAVRGDHRRLGEVDVAVDEAGGNQRSLPYSLISALGGNCGRILSAGPK